MNKMGVMKGNKTTEKGMKMEKKHEKDMEKHHGGKGTRARLNTAATKHFFGSRVSK